MSTMFTSAAMGLLSRTIQALLSKYLSDVDVEGVEVPSFTDSSGWGVRLSNVRLRDGTQLLVLPGKKTSKAAHSTSTETNCTESVSPLRAETRTSAGKSDQRNHNGKADASPTSGSARPTPRRSGWFSWSRSDQTVKCESEELLDDQLSERSMNHSAENSVCSAAVKDTSMVLTLGTGGKIGVLDVRLVGKSVNVLIEDAELTLVVAEVPAANDEDTKEDHPDLPKPDAAKIPQPKESAGDRVLAENIAAKVLSAIPNLFLRDISLRVVLPASHSGPAPTCVEVNIGFLSVTDGADFMMNFGPTHGGDEDDRSQSPSTGSEASNDSIASEDEAIEVENEFLTKRLRTGKGSEGGILVRIHSEPDGIPKYCESDHVWARTRWYRDTDFVLLRCSGLELLARIFLGTKSELAQRRQDRVEYEEVDIDTLMFGGCDYVAPGPSGPPPRQTPEEPPIGGQEESWLPTNGLSKLFKQKNGIQVYDIPSHFYKVAQGLRPHCCSEEHLPAVQCPMCWKSNKLRIAQHRLDNCSPLGGLVCHLSLREPLEVNIDRFGLETISTLIGLFSKPKTPSHHSSTAKPTDLQSRLRKKPNPRKLHRNQSTKLRESFDESRRSVNTTFDVPSGTNDEEASDDSEEMLPSYMQPEKICFAGLYISEIRCRVHALKSQKTKQTESGTSFRYWDAHLENMSSDFHVLTAEERPFQDIKLGFGFAKVLECKGVEVIEIASLGERFRSVRSAVSVPSSMLSDVQYLRWWPSVASVMLDIPPPLAAVDCKAVQDRGIQLRYCSVKDDLVRTRCLVAHITSPSIGTSLSIKDDIAIVVSEAIGMFRAPTAANDKPKANAHSSLLRYRVSTGAGRVSLTPLVDARFPALSVSGEVSSEAGFSLEAVFSGIKVKVGKTQPPKISEVAFSLGQLAMLPESVRLRILLFLKDLSPLQAALGLPLSQNSFLACRAVNNGIVKAAAAFSQYKTSQSTSTSREEMVRELLSLDNNSLSQLLKMQKTCQQ